MYLSLMYIVFCADDVENGDVHTIGQKIGRVILWPLTITSWFRCQNIRLHRMLNILWCVLIIGWFLSLMSDKL